VGGFRGFCFFWGGGGGFLGGEKKRESNLKLHLFVGREKKRKEEKSTVKIHRGLENGGKSVRKKEKERIVVTTIQ